VADQSVSRLRVTAFVLITAVVVLAVSCSSDSSTNEGTGGSSGTVPSAITQPQPAEPTAGGTLAFGLGAESDGWDPTFNRWAGSGTIVSHAIFDRLTEYDENHNAQPFLAESLTPNPDFTRWTIKLRSGITFHDGTELDAEAVKVNLETHKTSVLTGAALQIIGQIEVVDGLTLQVTMNSPWATFPSALTTQAGVVAAPTQLQNAAEKSLKPIGTGPFVFDNWRPDSNLEVTKNPDYWLKDANGGSLPYLDGIQFEVLSDVQSRGAALESGAVEAIETFDPNQIKQYQSKAEQGQYQMYSNQNREEAVQFLGLNTAQPPFDDPLARQIVVYSLDTQTISTTQYADVFPVANGLFPENSAYHADTGYPTYDSAKASELHDEYQAKYGKPLSFTVNLPSTPEFKAIGELAKESAAANGVEVTLNLMDQSALIVAAVTGDYDATGFITFGDPNIDQIFFSNDTLKPVGEISLNFTRLRDDALTDYLHQARETDVTADQAAAWAKAQERIAENLNVLFVVRNGVAVIYDTNVFGFLDAKLPSGAPIELNTSPFTTWVFKP
jgi:ABC-type transport system substrate-binding protein